MSNVKDKARIYETILSSPGMKEKCKVAAHLSRSTILFLCGIIEAGLSPGKDNVDDLVQLLTQEAKEELKEIVPEFLKKADLADLYEKLKTI